MHALTLAARKFRKAQRQKSFLSPEPARQYTLRGSRSVNKSIEDAPENINRNIIARPTKLPVSRSTVTIPPIVRRLKL